MNPQYYFTLSEDWPGIGKKGEFLSGRVEVRGNKLWYFGTNPKNRLLFSEQNARLSIQYLTNINIPVICNAA